MKKALVVLLLAVVLLTGLPILMGMSGMVACADCGPAVPVGPWCAVAVLAGAVVIALGPLGQRLRPRSQVLRLRLQTFVLERPPRLA